MVFSKNQTIEDLVDTHQKLNVIKSRKRPILPKSANNLWF